VYTISQAKRGESHSIDCHGVDCHDSPTLNSSFDWLNLDQVCDEIVHVSDESVDSDSPTSMPSAFNFSLLSNVDLLPASSPSSFPVIFDSGASLAISPSLADFSGAITKYTEDKRLGGMANGMRIEGIGNIQWSFRAGKKLLVVHSRCYYVPDSKARLISPQRLFNKAKGVNGSFTVLEEHAVLSYTDVADLIVEYCPRSNLPLALAKNLSSQPSANLTVLDDSNQNLTPSQKLLLTWHARFGHKGFSAIQRIFKNSPFLSAQFTSASRCEIPKCEVCQYSKAHRKPTKGNKQTTNPLTDGALKAAHLRAGAAVSVDHFESRLKGRTYTSFGCTTSDQPCISWPELVYLATKRVLGFAFVERENDKFGD
jgi:hypothetical protein